VKVVLNGQDGQKS